MHLSRPLRVGAITTMVCALGATGGFAVAATTSPPAQGYVFLADKGGDASVAAATAGKVGASVLLSEGSTLTKSTADAIERLHPKLVVVVGGPSVIPAGVVTAVNRLAPTHRVYGSSVFDTAAALAVYAASLPGVTGTPGPAGKDGKDGAIGATILSGTGGPAGTVGKDGDYYLNRETGTLYGPRTLGAWPSQTVTLVGKQGPVGLVGPQGPKGAAGAAGAAGASGAKGETGAAGAAGATILSGSGTPDAAVGRDGDYYVSTVTATLFGPKLGGSWSGAGLVLVGPRGDKGDRGADGTAGATGAVGAIGAPGAMGPMGVSGVPGPVGPRGADGATGPKGAIGADGPKGDTGDKGDQGDQGSPGTPGEVGPAGPAGPAGSGGGGVTVSDSGGHTLGLALTMTRSSVTVLTPAGYQAIFSWDGKLAGSQMYWTGPSCTSGTAYLNSGSPTAASITPKVIAYAKTTGTLLIPATVGSDGLSPVVPNVAVQSIDNNPCGTSSSGSGYLLTETTADAVGLPDQVVGPLTTP